MRLKRLFQPPHYSECRACRAHQLLPTPPPRTTRPPVAAHLLALQPPTAAPSPPPIATASPRALAVARRLHPIRLCQPLWSLVLASGARLRPPTTARAPRMPYRPASSKQATKRVGNDTNSKLFRVCDSVCYLHFTLICVI